MPSCSSWNVPGPHGFQGRHGGHDLLSSAERSSPWRDRCLPRLHLLQRRTLQELLGQLHTSRLLVAPAFTWLAVDIVGPFMVKCVCGSNHHAKAKAWILVIRCPSTNAISAEVMETLSSASATNASRYGHAQHITSDRGSQFMSHFGSKVSSLMSTCLFSRGDQGESGPRRRSQPCGDL